MEKLKDNEKIKIHNVCEVFKGFTIQEGFVSFLDEEGNPLQITSGWTAGSKEGDMYVYTYNPQTNNWDGNIQFLGIGDDLYDIEDVKSLQYELEIAQLSAKAEALNKKLHESEVKMVFVEQLSGDMSNYHELTPTREKGVYFYEIALKDESIGDGWYYPTDTSYIILTKSDFRKMKKKYNLIA